MCVWVCVSVRERLSVRVCASIHVVTKIHLWDLGCKVNETLGKERKKKWENKEKKTKKKSRERMHKCKRCYYNFKEYWRARRDNIFEWVDMLWTNVLPFRFDQQLLKYEFQCVVAEGNIGSSIDRNRDNLFSLTLMLH